MRNGFESTNQQLGGLLAVGSAKRITIRVVLFAPANR